MNSRPKVLILDDGELGRIRQALGESGGDLEHHSGEVLLDDLEGPYDVAFATVKRILAYEGRVDLASFPGKPTWIVVHGQDFLPLRVRLRQMGVSFLVQSSVSSAALRLLLAQTIHQGEEKRGAPRLPVGSMVNCSGANDSPFQAEMLDLGREGCRLVMDRSIRPGAIVSVGLPSELSGEEKLYLPGRIQREDPHDDPHKRLVIVGFKELSADSRELLDAILAGKLIGTVVTRLGDALDDKTDTLTIAPRDLPEAVPEQSAYPYQRRRRVVFAREVTVLLGSSEFVILARDLSIGGVRAEPLPELPLGTSLEFTLDDPSGTEPVQVRAVVARDDGPGGTVFQFEEMAPDDQARLERIIASTTEVD